MAEPARQVLVWNRAALEGGGSSPCEGDLALAGLLRAHGIVMNGGVDHALEVLSRAELMAAIAGYRYFGFDVVALLLEQADAVSASDAGVLNSSYWREISGDAAIAGAFRQKLLSLPDAFAPVSCVSNA